MNLRKKKTMRFILVSLFFVSLVLIVYAVSSVESENGMLNFSNNNKAYEFNSNSARSKKVDFGLSIVENENNSGILIVEVFEDKDSILSRHEVRPGESISVSNYFSKGGKEKIVLNAENFSGSVTYSKKIIKFF